MHQLVLSEIECPLKYLHSYTYHTYYISDFFLKTTYIGLKMSSLIWERKINNFDLKSLIQTTELITSGYKNALRLINKLNHL